jgi:Xaa-Pro aminopeptidase
MIDPRAFRGGQYAAELESPGVYRRRRAKIRERLGAGDVAVVLGATDARGYGDVGTFRQEPGYFYLTGVELPGSALMLEREHETLLLPARRPALEAWTGPKYGPDEEAARELGFERVVGRDPSEIVVDARRRPVPGLLDRVGELLQGGGALWVVLPGSSSGDLTREQSLAQGLRDRLPSFPVRDLGPLLTELRLRKSPGEVALMRKAVAATIAAMSAAAFAIRPGAREG